MYAFNSAAIFSPGHPYIGDRTCINRPLGAKHNFSVWAKLREKQSFSEFHFIVYIILASSKVAFSAVTASLPSFVRPERKVMAAVTRDRPIIPQKFPIIPFPNSPNYILLFRYHPPIIPTFIQTSLTAGSCESSVCEPSLMPSGLAVCPVNFESSLRPRVRRHR